MDNNLLFEIFRVNKRDQAAHGEWNFRFITDKALEKYDQVRQVQYLKDDCLWFRVLSVSRYPMVSTSLPSFTSLRTISHPSMEQPDRVVPYEFPFSNYEEMCEDSEQWFSRSFFTRAGGYRMCVEVAPQGNGEGKGTHISICIYMMKGEHDDILKWPFRGEVTIQLLNQLEDQCHHEVIIRFTEMVPGICCDR